MSRLLRAALFAVFGAAASGHADPGPGATPVDLAVRVFDPSGAAVPKAVVSLVSEARTQQAKADGRGVARFARLAPGLYTVIAEAKGFAARAVPDVRLEGRSQELELALDLAAVEEAVVVSGDVSPGRERDFTRVLTAEDLADLPDDPDELQEALLAMAGPDAMMRVNGFAGGRMPAKSQIRQVRFQTNAYAAENHEMAHTFVDVITKPGLGSWRTSASLGLRDGSWAARPPLSDARADADFYGRATLSFDGPLVKDRTSLSLSLTARDTSESRAVRAQTAMGLVDDPFRPQTKRLDVQARVEHALGKTHTVRAELTSYGQRQEGLGVGGLVLPERGYTQDLDETRLRVSDVGLAWGKLATETRLELARTTTLYEPATLAPAIEVAGAFSAGGATVEGRQRARSLDLFQAFDVSRGKHALRFGGQLQSQWIDSTVVRDARGTFGFDDLAAWRAGRPSTWSRREAGAPVEYAHHQAALFVQDDWKLSRQVLVGLGLRYEAQSRVSDALSLAPRASLTWAPNDRTSLRLGAGVFHAWLGAETYEEALRSSSAGREEFVIDPGWPDPQSGAPASSAALPTRRQLGDLSLARVTRFSLGVERQLGAQVRLNASYVHERGEDLYRGRNLNPVVATGERSLAELGNLLSVESEGRSRKHTLRADARLGAPMGRLSGIVGYALTFARDDADGPFALPADETDPGAEWGPARDDVRHRLFGFATWRLRPDLRLATSFRAQGGAPYPVTLGRDLDGDGLRLERPDGFGRNAGRGSATIDLGLRLSWSFGLGTRTTPAGPGAPRVITVRAGDDGGPPDIGGPGRPDARVQVTLHAQALNAFNRTNALAWSGVWGAPTFGTPLLALPGRRLELGASVRF
jgi:hypothetical protein